LIIRKAELKDTQEIVGLVRRFFEEAIYDFGLKLDQETIEVTVDNYINNLITIVAEVEGKVVGVTGGVLMPSIFDKNQNIAQETVWYVDKNYRNGSIGLKLIKAFEKECLSRGANLIIMGLMGNLNTDILDRYYRKRNYKVLERNYVKYFKGDNK